MTEEQIFKTRFPEYCVGERCLLPYFDLFQIGFEEGESRLKAIYKKQRNKRIDKLQKQNNLLKKENARLKKESEENRDLATIAYMQGASKYKTKLDEAKEIIRELLLADTRKGSDWTGYLVDLKERAEAFLKESGE